METRPVYVLCLRQTAEAMQALAKRFVGGSETLTREEKDLLKLALERRLQLILSDFREALLRGGDECIDDLVSEAKALFFPLV